MTTNEIKLLIELEKKFNILSSDSIWQEELFDMQENLCNRMVESANGSKGKVKLLKKELPYLFS